MRVLDALTSTLFARVVLGHRRTFIAAAIGGLAWFLLPVADEGRTRFIVAWDIGVLSFLLLTLHLFLTHDAGHMPALAEAQEDGQWAIFWVALLVSVVSFFAVTSEFAYLKDLHGAAQTVRVLFVAATLLLSWLLTHVVFALRYGHEWYDSDHAGGPRKGLDFPGDDEPDYLDFLYFSLVLGMTFQVSDVQITGARFRRMATLHGLVSFLYSTVILALTVNLAAGLLA